jgi:hypothetical protein
MPKLMVVATFGSWGQPYHYVSACVTVCYFEPFLALYMLPYFICRYTLLRINHEYLYHYDYTPHVVLAKQPLPYATEASRATIASYRVIIYYHTLCYWNIIISS